MTSRRNMARTLVAGAVLMSFGLGASAAEQKLAADIVVVGAGSAGLSAAVAAAEKGAKVIVLEKMPLIGGLSQFAEGVFAVNSEWNRLRSDTLTREKAFEAVAEKHMHEMNLPLARDYIWGSGENVEWISKHDIKIEVVRMTPWEEATWHVFSEFKAPDGKVYEHGAALVQGMYTAATKLGVKTMLATPATELISDKSGKIIGVKAKNDEDTFTISAKAVILATGSMGDNKEKLREWCGRDPEFWKQSINWNKTGDGILMAMNKGAARGEIGFVGHLGTEGKAIDFPRHLYTTSWQPSALWVNSDGERFDNEAVAFSFSQAANAIYNQFGHSGWSIFDESQVEYMEKKGVDSGVGVLVPVGKKLTTLREEMKRALDVDSDGFKSASSVAELAKKIGVPAANLEASVKKYNQACELGFDKEFFKDERYLRKIDTKKMYAIKLRSFFFSAFGGLNTNRKFEVLDTKNQPISGLYATGLDVSRALGHTYTTWTSGWAFGFACYSGRHAALNAVEAISKK